MDYRFSDGWIFRAIQLTSGDELSEVIGTADYINKAIPDYKEINHACTKLTELGFIEIKVGKFIVTDSGGEFIDSIEWDFERSQHPYKFASAVSEELAKVKSAGDEFDIYFSPQEIEVAINAYMKAIIPLGPDTVVIDARDP